MTSSDTVPDRPSFARIWDVPVRLFHWLLVALLGFSWWSGKQHAMEWHRLSGYCILALLIFRIYWGFAGSGTARFVRFVRGPRIALDYARTLVTGRHVATVGHNPIGGWSVLLMLATLSAMVVGGLFAVDVDGIESGPLSDYVSFENGRLAARIHAILFDVILGVVALHVLAILFYAVRLRRNLVGPMITGRRRGGGGEPAEDLSAPLWRAVPGVIVAVLGTYAVAQGFRL